VKIAFLGLGAIGAPMARHLAREPFELTVWNRSNDKARAFALEHRVQAAQTPAEAVQGADVVITCLPSSREVKSILEGPDGILASIATGSIFIDCTSGDPATSNEIARQLSAKEIAFIDTPVSGGVKGAEAGTLTVMCGGSGENIDRARPVLEAFGKKIIRCGDVGAGDAVKAMNQALLAIHIWSAGEALAALAKLGVDTHVALDVINRTSGRSNSSEKLFKERVIGRAFPRTFKLALLDKDVSIAKKITGEIELSSPFIELAARLFSEAHEALGEEADHVEAVKVIEERAGVLVS
jgi:3-hydroxyisobutyrate dehydrogenase